MSVKIIVVLFTLLTITQCADFETVKLQNSHIINETFSSVNINALTSKCGQFVGNWSTFDLLLWKDYVYMFDSSGIWISGLLQGNLANLGVYDECVTYTSTFDGEEYQGKYCIGATSEPLFTALKYGKCLPSFCTTEDFKNIFGLEFQDIYCSVPDNLKEWTTRMIVATCFLGILLALAIISTSIEVFFILNITSNESYNGILTAFSVIRNTKKVIECTTNPNQLLCLNGLKALSMMYIILFHEFQNNMTGPVNNFIHIKEFIGSRPNMFYFQGAIAVDTFFAVGGLVAMYTIMKNYDKSGQYDIIPSYIHRYIRLTPALLVMIVLHACLLNELTDGPFHGNVYSILVKQCESYFGPALLYIQNYYNCMEDCVPQSWYLSVDMQLFILAPILVVPLLKSPKIGTYFVYFLLLVSVAVPLAITLQYRLPYAGYVTDDNSGDYMTKYYMKTHCRFGVYVLGIFYGRKIYIIKTNKITIRYDRLFLLGRWILIMAGIFGGIFGAAAFMTMEKSVIVNAIWNSTFRLVFALAICELSYLCVTDNGGIIDYILSLPVFQVLTKLSYAMYLTHYSIQILRISSNRNPVTYSGNLLIFSFFGDFILTLLVSYLLVVIVEFPFGILDSYLTKLIVTPQWCRVRKNPH